MTISKELLEASGLIIDDDQCERIKHKTNIADIRFLVNQFLCEKLEVLNVSIERPTLEISAFSPIKYLKLDHFVLQTKPQPIPPPKEVMVTESIINEIAREYRQNSSWPVAGFSDYLKQKLFGDK